MYQKALKESAKDNKAVSAQEKKKTESETTWAITKEKDRANKKGDLINEYYQALDRKQWKRYYDVIAEKGWLISEIGDIAAIVIDNKLIISQRKQITNNTNDFQVIDAYKLEGTKTDYNILNILAEKIEWEINYDEQTVRRIYGNVYQQYDENALFARYDRTEHAFISNAAKTFNGKGSDANRNINREETFREGILEGTSKTLQSSSQRGVRGRSVSDKDKPKYTFLQAIRLQAAYSTKFMNSAPK